MRYHISNVECNGLDAIKVCDSSHLEHLNIRYQMPGSVNSECFGRAMSGFNLFLAGDNNDNEQWKRLSNMIL